MRPICVIVYILLYYSAAIVNDKIGTSLHFAHGSTCFPHTAILGLYNDTVPPTSSNYDDRHNRVWDTSFQLPMATNFAYALYECEGEGDGSDYFVRFHHMEDAMLIPGCSGLMCPFEELTAMWADIVNTCDFEAICEYP